MSSKIKPYDHHPARGGVHPYAASSSLTNFPRVHFIKLLALLIVCFLSGYFMHGVLVPSGIMYGLMIDAGSTGSRIHTFTLRRNPNSHILHALHEDFFPLKPGLSHYKHNPTEAAKSLLPLLRHARTRVPRHLQSYTPVVLRATAGLRMVGDDAAQNILTAVRSTLRDSGFRFDGDGWATILSGNEEAVYSWMTVNYLLGRDADHTVGTLEMGGGSAQIAYVPRASNALPKTGECNITGEALSYGGKDVELYATSHLDYGLQKARANILQKFKEGKKLYENPCFNTGKTLSFSLPFEAPPVDVTVSGQGDYAACQDLLIQMFIDPALKQCRCDTCTYKGMAQPRAIDEFVALAFYRERTAKIGMGESVSVSDIDEKGKEVCSMTADNVNMKYNAVPNGKGVDLCLDLAYISLHLQRGHGIRADGGTRLQVANKINGFELGWCLGAIQQTMAKMNEKP